MSPAAPGTHHGPALRHRFDFARQLGSLVGRELVGDVEEAADDGLRLGV